MSIQKRLPNLPPCKICGEPASGFHYGLNSCGACKGFFLRSLSRVEPYTCTTDGKCKVGPETKRRKSCQKCRFDKCLRLGMSKNAIKIGRYTYSKRTKDTLELHQLKLNSMQISQEFVGTEEDEYYDTESEDNVTQVFALQHLSSEDYPLVDKCDEVGTQSLFTHISSHTSPTECIKMKKAPELLSSLDQTEQLSEHAANWDYPLQQTSPELFIASEKYLQWKISFTKPTHCNADAQEDVLNINLPSLDVINSDFQPLQGQPSLPEVKGTIKCEDNYKIQPEVFHTLHSSTSTHGRIARFKDPSLNSSHLAVDDHKSLVALHQNLTPGKPHNENRTDTSCISNQLCRKIQDGGITLTNSTNSWLDRTIARTLQNGCLQYHKPFSFQAIQELPVTSINTITIYNSEPTVSPLRLTPTSTDHFHRTTKELHATDSSVSVSEKRVSCASENDKNCDFELWSNEFTEDELIEWIDHLVRYHRAHIFDNTSFDQDQLKARTDSVYNKHRLQETTFGELKALDRELYFEVYMTTGLDVDGRRRLMSSLLLGIHNEISTVIKFFKQIPGFKVLPTNDQIKLVKGCSHEYHILGLYRGWDNLTRCMTFTTLGETMTEQDLRKVFPDEALNAHIQMVMMLQKLDLTAEQIVLLKAIVATAPDRENLEAEELVSSIHWRLVNCLLYLLWRQDKNPHRKFAQIMSVLTEMRSYSLLIRTAYSNIRSDVEELTGRVSLPFIYELFF